MWQKERRMHQDAVTVPNVVLDQFAFKDQEISLEFNCTGAFVFHNVMVRDNIVCDIDKVIYAFDTKISGKEIILRYFALLT